MNGPIVAFSSCNQPGQEDGRAKTPRKILHILNELRFSGAETMLACAGPAFAAAGWQSHILSTGDNIGSFAPILAQRGYVLHHMPFIKKVAFFAQVRRLIAEGGFDVVHIHSERAYPLYALLAAPSARVVRTVHSTFLFNGPLRLRKTLERQFCRWLLNVTFIAPSRSVQDNERLRFGSPARLCPNWYDDTHYRPPTPDERAAARARLGYGPDQRVIVSVGSYIPLKNQDNILEALALWPQGRMDYLHVGSHLEGATGRSLTARAVRLGLGDRLRCAGESGDVRSHLWAADIFVMPSLWEGVGIAAIEAMATGLPAILSDRPGLADFRALAPEIRYCEPSASGIIQQVRALAVLPEAARRGIGDSLAQAMRRHFSTGSGIRQYLDLYQGL